MLKLSAFCGQSLGGFFVNCYAALLRTRFASVPLSSASVSAQLGLYRFIHASEPGGIKHLLPQLHDGSRI